MIMGNVSERRKQPPQVGVSVVILALGPSFPRNAGTCSNQCGIHLVDTAGPARAPAFSWPVGVARWWFEG